MKKENFIEIINSLKKQKEKDRKLVDFLMNGYLDGISPIPIFSEELFDITIKLIAFSFEGEIVFNKNYQNWMEWFVYENDFGEKKMRAFLNDTEYIISNSEDFYDFLILICGENE